MQVAWERPSKPNGMASQGCPIDGAVELLESALADMLAVRVAAWKQLVRKRTPSPIGTLPFTKRERRIMAMLGVRERSLVTPTAALPAACERCGERLDWRKRSDARRCSSRCRQASYRRRAA